MVTRARLATLAALALLAAPAASQPSGRARYLMQGTVHVTGSGLDRDIDLHADAVVEPGSGPAEVVLKIAAQDHDCRLVARRDAGGALAFAPAAEAGMGVPWSSSAFTGTVTTSSFFFTLKTWPQFVHWTVSPRGVT